jgi:hypothetical protein
MNKYLVLRNESGQWLGNVVINKDGFFGAVTDWGNFSYQWNSFGGDFEEFLLSLNVHYFTDKMCQGISYQFGNSKKNKDACFRFSDKILPALQRELQK